MRGRQTKLKNGAGWLLSDDSDLLFHGRGGESIFLEKNFGRSPEASPPRLLLFFLEMSTPVSNILHQSTFNPICSFVHRSTNFNLFAPVSKKKERKMAHCLSNLSISLPLSSRNTSANSKLSFPNSPNCLNPTSVSSSRIRKNSILAVAGDRDSLDHLQRSSKQQQPQQPPKKRVAQVAPIGLWDRFPTARTMQQMMETMDRVMEDPYAYSGGGGWTSPVASETGGYSRGRTPWEIKEGEGDYKMRFDMPGMTKEDVKVWVEEKMLVVRGEKVPRKKSGQEGGEEEQGEWSAKSYGRYNTRIALPENVEFENIKAEVKDGVLYITVPKASSSSKVFDISVQ